MTRRSCASEAYEPSIDWFWHTTQRSSCERWRARVSSAGSLSISLGSTAAAGERTIKKATSASVRWRTAQSEKAARQSPFAARHFLPMTSLRGRERGDGAGAGGAPGRANAQAAVEQGGGGAQRHHPGAGRDQADHRGG